MPASVFPTSTNRWHFDNSFARLPETLYQRIAPSPVANPAVAIFNSGLAAELGLPPEVAYDAALLAGNKLPEGADPIAQAYAGHQFGHFTNLGDGRAILLGEQITPQGRRFDLQLKGSGPTPYSRRGDGRAALGPMLREYIMSEALHALGIPTTRSLAVVTTGEMVSREESLPGAVLARVAASHIRVGTFQYAAARGDRAVLASLLAHTVARHDPALAGVENEALAMFDAVLERQAALMAQWMLVGFIHGVMNTDNMALSGETIDYGPCAFIDTYDPATVFSSIDRNRRYAYANQPSIAQWNLARLAETLLPLIAEEEKTAVALAESAVAKFEGAFQGHWLEGMRKKLGLFNAEEEDLALAQDFFKAMEEAKADLTNTFAGLAERAQPESTPILPPWEERWQARLSRQPQETEEVVAALVRANPVVIPRNHRVEEALKAAGEGDFGVMEKLLSVLVRPYEATLANQPYRQPPAAGGESYRTYCGT